MNPFTIIITGALLLFSCGDPYSGGSELSSIGFYSKPETLISVLEPRSTGPREHFMLGVEQFLHANAADVSRATRDKDFHTGGHASGRALLWQGEARVSFIHHTLSRCDEVAT